MQPLSTVGPGKGRIGDKQESLDRSRRAMRMGFKSLVLLQNKWHGQKLIICGGGPSLQDTLPDIRRQLRLSKRTKVMAINKTHDWLLKKGLKPDFGIMIDPKQWVSTYQTPQKGVFYCLGSKLHDDTLNRFKGLDNAYLWHNVEYSDEAELMQKEFPKEPGLWVPGYSTCGLRAINVAYELGFRTIELHGFDCSHKSGNTHAYDKQVSRYDILDEVVEMQDLEGHTRRYRTDRHMARQLHEFDLMLQSFLEGETVGLRQHLDIRVAGTGALPYHVAKGRNWVTRNPQYQYPARHADERYNQDPESMPYEPVSAFEPQGLASMNLDLSSIAIPKFGEAA